MTHRPTISPPTPPAPHGSPQAFSQAHAALASWLRRRLVDLTGDAHAADDLSQRTWQAVWEAVSTGRYDPHRAALSTFVFAVSQNTYRAWARARATAAHHAPAVAAATGEAADSAAPDPMAESELVDELRRILRDGQAGFTPDHLSTLHLIARGVTDRELAAELGVAPSTAHARKRGALAVLRAHLEKRFYPERPDAHR